MGLKRVSIIMEQRHVWIEHANHAKGRLQCATYRA
jgi:hypothetical protein